MKLSIRAGAAGAVVAALLQLTACGGGDDTPPTQRTTSYGTVSGTDASAVNGTYQWKGVPFAKPPIGDLRWKAPVDPDAWPTTRSTQQFGNACAQTGRLYSPGANNRYDDTIGATLGKTVGSEDCLYLNIWQPSAAKGKLPVIVFVHGGSNITGYTADPIYDGAALATTANAVVVTVNYRLAAFGFFSMPQLKTGADAYDDSGNYAMLDLVKALKFVNKNIASFGGDPANVTVMGQSAGAVNVYALMTSPLVVNASPALVHRVAPISGGISLASNLPAGALPTLAPVSTYTNQSSALLQYLLIGDGTAADTTAAQAYIATQSAAQIAAYMRSKSTDTLLNTVLTKLAPLGLSGAGPIPEGTVLPVDPIAAINAGAYTKVPVLAGNTRDEAKLFPSFLALSPALGGVSGRLLSDSAVFSLAFTYNPEAAPTTTVEQWIPAQYLPVATPVTGFNAKTDLLNAYFFIASRDSVLTALKAQQANVWYYQFDWDEEPAPFNDIYGAAHAFDLPFLFGNFGPSLYANISYTVANRPGRLALSDAMMRALGAFALNGDPNAAALGVTWPAWPSQLLFDATPAAKAITVR